MILLTFTLLLLALIGSTSSCEVGVPHESSTLNVPRLASSSGTQVYLGLENPASCGGYLINYTICYYNRNAGTVVMPGELSIWEIGPELSDGFRVYDKISESVLDLPFTTDNDTSCGIDPVVTPISNAPDPYPAVEIVCMYYCLPETLTVYVKTGSVVGIVYTDGVGYGRGQMLTHHTLQTVGTCVGIDFRFSLGELVGVSCPLVPANTTTALLAGAGIEPIYCPELSLQYGNINISGPYYYGTGIEYTCQTGFQLVGVSSQTCLSSGDWSDELPYCNVLNCTDPGVPSNGNRDLHSFTNGSSVFFYCYNGFTLRGNRLITCYRGTWTAPVPECVLNNKIGLTVGLAVTTLLVILVVIITVILVIVIVMFKHKIKKIKKQNYDVDMIETNESPAYNLLNNDDDDDDSMQYNQTYDREMRTYATILSLDENYERIEDY